MIRLPRDRQDHDLGVPRQRPASRADYLVFLHGALSAGAVAEQPADRFPADAWRVCDDRHMVSSVVGAAAVSGADVAASTRLPTYVDVGQWHLERLREGDPTLERAQLIIEQGDDRARHPSQRELKAPTAAVRAASRWKPAETAVTPPPARAAVGPPMLRLVTGA